MNGHDMAAGRDAAESRRVTVSLLIAVSLLITAQLLDLRWLAYAAKPVAILLCVRIAVTAAPRPTPRYRTLVLAGLGMSAVGDVLLMLPQDLFAPGLGAFLVAHLLYIAAFTSAPGRWSFAPAPLLGLLPPAAVTAWLIWPGVPGVLRAPVAAYLAVIVTMAWQAMARAQVMRTAGASSAAIGAALFVASDAALAINRFRAPFALAPVVVLGTYFAAQWCIARSVGDPGAPPVTGRG